MTAPHLSTEVIPAAFEVAVTHLPSGGSVRVMRPDGTQREYAAKTGEPLVLITPGDASLIGWGATVIATGLRAVRNGHHRLDRAAWHEAARAVRGGGVVYVQYEQQDYYGKSRWTAVAVRDGQESA